MIPANTQAHFSYSGKDHLEFRINAAAFTQDISEVTFDFTEVMLQIPQHLKIRLSCGLVCLELQNCGKVWNDPSIFYLRNNLEFDSALRANPSQAIDHAPFLAPHSEIVSGLNLQPENSSFNMSFPDATLPQEMYLTEGLESATRIHTTRPDIRSAIKGKAVDGPGVVAPPRTSKRAAKLENNKIKSCKNDLVEGTSRSGYPTPAMVLAPEAHAYSVAQTEPSCSSFSDLYATDTNWLQCYQPGAPSGSSHYMGRSPIPFDVTAGPFNHPSPAISVASSSGPVRQHLKRGREEDASDPAPAQKRPKTANRRKKSAVPPASQALEPDSQFLSTHGS
jgi:hypothetical protein